MPVIPNEATTLYARADELTELQRQHRGWVRAKDMDDKPCLILGPYIATPESEARAAEIVRLRKRAARIEHPR